jgi:hypothetical protein
LHGFTGLVECALTPNRSPAAGIFPLYSAKHTCLNDQRRGLFLLSAVPIAETHPCLSKTFADHNDYPWRAILEAVLRFVEEDLEHSGRAD